jgi:hypothetical protein
LDIFNKTQNDFGSFVEIVEKFLPFAQKQIGFNRPPTINLVSDIQNSADPMGKTAHYNPGDMSIVIYTDGRHPKDMLRSISHELVHHSQNCDGQFDQASPVGEDYAQTSPHLRLMEEDANLRGNMCVRDFVDQKLHLEESKRRKTTMIDEKNLRLAIKKLIDETVSKKTIDEALTPKQAYEILLASLLDGEDESALQGVSLSSVEDGPDPYKWRGDEDPDVVSGLADLGHERAEGTAALDASPWGGGNKARNAAEKAAAGDSEGEEEVEVELNETMLREVLSEARRRRRRRAARLAANQAAAAAAAAQKAGDVPAEKATPKTKKEPVKKELKSDKVIAKKVVATEKVKPIKEWYGEELFGRLIKEVVK